MNVLKKLLFLFFFLPVLGFGQGDPPGVIYDTLGTEARTDMAKKAIKDLKNGVLVVRLKSGNSQMKAMERVANSPNVAAKDKERFELKMAALRKSIQAENERLIKSLQAHYLFSEVLYIMDTSIYLLKENIQNGYFLNEQMEVDTSISLRYRNYLVAYYGAPLSSQKNGMEGIVVLDRDLIEMTDPFPFFTGISTSRKELGKFFRKKNELDYVMLTIERFNSKLEEFLSISK